MNNLFYRYTNILIIFSLVGIVHFLITQNPWILVMAACAAVITIVLETLLYEKKEMFLIGLVGLLLGYAVGVVFYRFISSFQPRGLPKEVEIYFVLITSYLGFYLPYTSKLMVWLEGKEAFKNTNQLKKLYLLDTSAIIDGRITDVINTGIMSGTLIIPNFVLQEVQALADSQDTIKRNRARRGMEILNSLKEVKNMKLKISSKDFRGIKGVDAKLIQYAKEIDASIITLDYNLNKVAELEGVYVLNLNDLVIALKPVLVAGETFEVEILREGKEDNQGIAYLSDGTMVIVANGKNLINKTVLVKITSILQTSAGKMLFSEIVSTNPSDIGA